MKRKNRIIAAVVALILVMQLVGCGKESDAIQTTENSEETEGATVEHPTAKESVPVETLTEEPENNGLVTLTPDMIDDTLKRGSHVLYGSYEQDNDKGNGSEPIEWVVESVQNGKALLVAYYALDIHPYCNGEYCSWEASSLRLWLNDNFYNTAFSDEEKQYIESSEVKNEFDKKIL